MKKWIGFVSALALLLVMALPQGMAFAQVPPLEPDRPERDRPERLSALVVEAPRQAMLGEEVTIHVGDRATGENVKDAEVWAITPNGAEAFRAAVADLRDSDQEFDLSRVVNSFGEFLGMTNGSGQLRHSFTTGGGHRLVALKEGHRPGATGIRIRIPVLTVEAPRQAMVGESVTITVGEKHTGDKVKDANIWAITPGNHGAFRTAVTELREAGDRIQAAEWERLVNAFGVFLGSTNGSGQLNHSFNAGGGHRLIALKANHHPGTTALRIRVPALTVEAPRKATVGEEVTIKVGERHTGNNVKDAEVWAITPDSAEAFRAAIAELREAGVQLRDMDLSALISSHGVFLGTTNGSGQLKHSFDAEGGHRLIALKADYRPGSTGIRIIAVEVDEPALDQQ